MEIKNDYEERATKEANIILEKERIVKSVEEQGGLWKTEIEVDTFVDSLKTDKMKRQALKTQLDFHKKVRGFKCEQSLFHLSSNNKNKPISEIKANLLKVASWKPSELIQEKETRCFDQPITLDPEILKKANEKNLTEATKTTLKAPGKPVKRKTKNISGQTVTKTARLQTDISTVSTPTDLLGKLVHHYTERCINNELIEDWFKGLILEMKETTHAENPKFTIQYIQCIYYNEGDDTSVFSFSDFQNGKVDLVNVEVEDFLDAKKPKMRTIVDELLERPRPPPPLDSDSDTDNDDDASTVDYQYGNDVCWNDGVKAAIVIPETENPLDDVADVDVPNQLNENQPIHDPNLPVDVPDLPVNVPNQPVDVPNQPVDVPNQPIHVPNLPVDVPNQPVDVPSQPIHVPNQPVNVPNQPIHVPNQPVDVPSQHIHVPNLPVNVPNLPVNVPNQPVNVPNQPVDVPNQPIHVPILPVDVPNQPIRFPNLPVDVPNLPVDVPNQPIHFPNQPVDVPNQPVHVPNQPVHVPNLPVNVPNLPVNVPNQPVNVPNQPVNVPNLPANVPNQPVYVPNLPFHVPNQPVNFPNLPVNQPVYVLPYNNNYQPLCINHPYQNQNRGRGRGAVNNAGNNTQNNHPGPQARRRANFSKVKTENELKRTEQNHNKTRLFPAVSKHYAAVDKLSRSSFDSKLNLEEEVLAAIL
ncbi:bromodomain-containing protein 4-like [Clytia hemisphaerica]|uniref:bromodomain-containing protein 4-like n=1 Tax=Clytia hemisphaerica TaxID=252671 RepID=UPI0034D7973E